MFSGTIWLWVGFNLFVLAMLALDLGVFHRRAHAVSLKEASIWSVVWITLAMVFNAGLYLFAGPEPALQFFTGYLIEKSLSVDNIFIFVLLFTYFKVPAAYQHRVLYWGILGALIMRGTLIAVGVALIESFNWIIYLFGAFLIFAVDSIPAVFAVTRDPFLVYTSNIFAILGLRSLYFVFAGIMEKFYYLKLGLSVILTFVGVKMVLADVFSLPTALSLVVIAVVLTIAIVASIVRTRHQAAKSREPEAQAGEASAREIMPRR